MIVTEQPADPSSYVQVDMQLLEGEGPVHIGLAAVRWSSATRFGLEYIKVETDEHERLKRFMETLGQNPHPPKRAHSRHRTLYFIATARTCFKVVDPLSAFRMPSCTSVTIPAFIAAR